MTSQRLAYVLALAVPAALLAGALVAQYGFGLPPCEMCWWQRYPHIAALGFAALGWATKRDAFVALAAIAILVSGALGAYHAGVEYGWWDGMTACTTTAAAGGGPPPPASTGSSARMGRTGRRCCVTGPTAGTPTGTARCRKT